MVAGNWKMHNGIAASLTLVRTIQDMSRVGPRTDVVVAPVFTALASVNEALRGTNIHLAAQDVHWEVQGALTGEISAGMLQEVGCSHCIVGHSERRALFHETDEQIAKKIAALRGAGIVPIACLGETLAHRNAGETFRVVSTQLHGMLVNLTPEAVSELVIAYEPVWAIGTGRTAKASDAQLVHAYLRDEIRRVHGEAADRVRILYGGSVKPDNAAELVAQPDVDGLLVGGASLDATSFARIIQAAA